MTTDPRYTIYALRNTIYARRVIYAKQTQFPEHSNKYKLLFDKAL